MIRIDTHHYKSIASYDYDDDVDDNDDNDYYCIGVL